MYSQNLYGEVLYGREKKTAGREEDDYIDLIPYYPEFMTEYENLKEILKAVGYELYRLYEGLEAVKAQRFIDTADEALSRWERERGIVTNRRRSLYTRRNIVKTRRRAEFTVEAVKELALAYTGAQVKVEEKYSEYKFIVKFISVKGIPPNFENFKKALGEITHAHMQWEFQFRYTTWGDLRKFTWGELAGKTWEEIKTMEEV